GGATARTGAVGLQPGRTHGGVEAPAERALGGVGGRPEALAVALGAPLLRTPARERGVPVGRARRLAVPVVPLADLLDDGVAGPAPDSTPVRDLRGRGHEGPRPLAARRVGRHERVHAATEPLLTRVGGLAEVRDAGPGAHQ